MASALSPPCAAKLDPYAHFPHLKDALTENGGVTERTALAGLYLFDNKKLDNRFLKNLTRVCDIKPQCQVLSEDATGSVAFPPTLKKRKHGYGFFLTFNQLLMAPAIRLEAHFTDRSNPTAEPYHEIAIEFPFNDRDGKQLQNFECYVDGTGATHVLFDSTGASYEGITLLQRVRDRFGQEENVAVKQLQYLVSTTPKLIHLVLQTGKLSSIDQLDFQKITSCLPGGTGRQLLSIGQPEFANYPFEERGTMPLPHKLMALHPPNPMVPLDCPLTFSSFNHFKVHQLGCASHAEWESPKALQQFAMCQHTIALYGLKGIPVIAMKFGVLPKNLLVSAGRVNLPNELEIKITFAVAGRGDVQYTAVRDPYLQGLPEHDAYFFITSHDLLWFRGGYSADNDDSPAYLTVSDIIPHPSNFLLCSLSNAVDSLEEKKHSHFLEFALGQNFESDSLKPTDVLTNLDAPLSLKNEVFQQLKDGNWNTEQNQVIDQLKCAKGGISIVTGTAGTGKTTLQMAIAVAFVKLGGRAACFATSNSNVVTQAETICELTKAIKGTPIRVVRIVSTSRGIGIRHLTATQAVAVKVGHSHGTVSTIWGLKFLRLDQREGKMDSTDPWKYTVEACMLEEAEKRELKFSFSSKEDGRVSDAWRDFRKYLDASLADDFWENEVEVRKYVEVFKACKGHLIALADIILTTIGNAQCSELLDFWARAFELYQRHGVKKVTCLCVLIDEVGKEQEISVWNAMLSAGLPRLPDFVMLLGDPKQLSPVNTSVTKGFQCNPFATRGDVSMLDRMIALGWPHVHLHVQQRMHPTLWKFPCSEFYSDSAMTCQGSDPGRLLEDVEPGLKAVLDGIIAVSYPQGLDGEQDKMNYLTRATDAQSRLHYLDFGVKPMAKKGHSVAIPAYIHAVFEFVIPALQQHFGKHMHRDVMIIAAYGNAVGQYHGKLHDLQKWQELSDSHYPRIHTVDSSQGQEAKMVIVDNSMVYRDRIGFMRDKGRSNVAMTRAKEVLWIVGGPLNCSRQWACPYPLSPFPKLKRKMQLQGQVHEFTI